MKFKAGNSYELPVKERIVQGNLQYFIVEHDGVEYRIRLYDFQKEQKDPVTLLCLARQVQDGTIALVQDYSAFLDQFYKVGEEYPFTVVSGLKGYELPYYTVRDNHGLIFNLANFGKAKLMPYQDIRCRVTKIDRYRLRLQLIDDEQVQRKVKFYSLPAIGAELCIGAEARLAESLLLADASYADIAAAYRSHRGEWVLMFLSKVRDTIETMHYRTLRRHIRILRAYVSVCLFLLEESRLISSLDDTWRTRWRRRLEGYVRHASTSIRALEMIDSGKHTAYLDDIIAKMRQSGYLYNPGDKLEVMNAIFALCPDIIEQRMDDILSIISDGNHSNWSQDPFRSAFIRVLDSYVRLNKTRADGLTYDDRAGRDMLQRMIRVLALRLLLSSKDDDFDIQEYRAALVRYLVFENEALAPDLLRKAFEAAAGTSESPLRFGWKSLDNLKQLALEAASADLSSPTSPSSAQYYMGKGAGLVATRESLHLVSQSRGGVNRAILPVDMLPWQNIQIYTSERIAALPEGCDDLDALSCFWADVEHALYEPGSLTRPSRANLRVVDAGDTVRVYVSEIEGDGRLFRVKPVDESISNGEGTLSLSEIVKYDVYGMAIDDFRDDFNNALVFDAKVLSLGSGDEPRYTLLPAIKDMVRNDLDEDTPLECLVMGWTKYKGRETYLGISAQGDPVNIVTESTKLSKGDYVVATYMSMEPTGRLLCRYNRPVDEDFNTFTPHDAIRTMLFLLKSSVFHIPETMDLASENTDDDLPESTIEPEHVVELIHIIDRVGSLESSYLRRFNYMAFARMLARLIDNNGLVQYYARRMSFVRRLRTFVSSGYINVDDIRADEENSGDYPVLEMRSRQLRILSYIYDSSKNDFLWDIIAGDYDETSVGLAKLALTANLSMEMDVDEAQGAITGRISQLLNIEVKIQQPIFLGEETQTLEFKSSYICPEDGLHIDMPRQRDHILQRICGFLNSAQGGKLYIGVNRYGYVVGNDDLYHHLFGGDRDKYELRVRNDIRINLGGAANDCISTLWLDPAESGGKNVFVIEIRPNQFGTEYGGKYWVRQGTSTYPYTRKEFLAMQANRTLADAQ